MISTGGAAVFPSPLAGEGGRGSGRMRGAGGAPPGKARRFTPHPNPLPQGERETETSRPIPHAAFLVSALRNSGNTFAGFISQFGSKADFTRIC